MPFRSRISLASVATSTRGGEDDRHHSLPSKEECELSAEKYRERRLGNGNGHGQGDDDDDDDDQDVIQAPPSPNPYSPSILPPPVVQSTSSKTKKTARVSGGLRFRWDRFIRRVTSGTAPSTSSLPEGSVGDSSMQHRFRNHHYQDDPDGPVDEVVVDREWSADIKTSSVTHSEHGASPDKSGASNQMGPVTGLSGGGAGASTDRESAIHQVGGFWGSYTFLTYIRWRLWPKIHSFFSTEFIDEKSEAHYKKENWFLSKNLALLSAMFLILNWTLAAALIPPPPTLSDKIFYYGVAPLLTFPVLPMVMFDWPRDRPMLYQPFLMVSTWMWSWYQLTFMNLCGHFGNPSLFSCGGKDFLTTFYYTSALQTIALFGLQLHRFPAIIGACCFCGLALGLIVPNKVVFLRNVVNFVCFQLFLLYVHYTRENAERRLYTLRDQLKIQYRATQKAQVNERKASDSKRRLTSCVRVPLNTALLAVQNMHASKLMPKGQEIEFKALEGSLNMMSKVLNDVLDFNRMDSGRFENALKPYSFHQVFRSLFLPLKLATDARGLEFVTDLDKKIDELARTSMYEALGDSKETIARRMAEHPDEEGVVVGDSTRLRQIITNLASNACKFTPTGGKLTVSTRLIIPSPHKSEQDECWKNGDAIIPSATAHTELNGDIGHQSLSTKRLKQHDVIHSKPPPPLEWMVVRIEVTDTGCGIRPRDMIQSKLFSAFNQTEQGRQQGGKGTGLGLALVRQIVKLSGGRLGVQSKVNEGSTFWVELPLGVGHKAVSAMTAAHLTLRDVTDGGRATTKPSTSNPPTNADVSSTPNGPISKPSALHNVMEQGGLVEISTNPGDVDVVTRTIGDPSTGTDLTPSDDFRSPSPSLSAVSLPSPTIPSASPPALLSRSTSPNPLTPPIASAPPPSATSTETVRPHHLSLPKPRRFTIDEAIPDISPSENSLSNHPASPSMTTNTSGTQASGTTSSSSNKYDPGMKVLVVDDDPLTRRLMSRMLTRLGCKVWTAENGEVALDMILGHLMHNRATPSSEDTGSGGLMAIHMTSSSPEAGGGASVKTAGNGFTPPVEEYRFAVVFLDNQMPVLSGLELVARLRAMGRKDFIVGVTGNALLTDQQEYLDAGVDHVLTKPVYEKSLTGMLAIADDKRKNGSPTSEYPLGSPLIPTSGIVLTLPSQAVLPQTPPASPP